MKNRFCLVCGERESDPASEIKFKLQCKKCKRWICQGCLEELKITGLNSCPYCKAQLWKAKKVKKKVDKVIERYEQFIDTKNKVAEKLHEAYKTPGTYELYRIDDAVAMSSVETEPIFQSLRSLARQEYGEFVKSRFRKEKPPKSMTKEMKK